MNGRKIAGLTINIIITPSLLYSVLHVVIRLGTIFAGKMHSDELWYEYSILLGQALISLLLLISVWVSFGK